MHHLKLCQRLAELFTFCRERDGRLKSGAVDADGKGAAMGVYSTCQFMGAFAGGAGGGWLLQHVGAHALIGACLGLVLIWWLAVFRAGPDVQSGGTPAAAR